MADDAAAPDGELSKSTATEEASTATEPEASGTEVSDTAVTDGAEDSADPGEEARATKKPRPRSRGCRM